MSEPPPVVALQSYDRQAISPFVRGRTENSNPPPFALQILQGDPEPVEWVEGGVRGGFSTHYSSSLSSTFFPTLTSRPSIVIFPFT